jgi:hypothetical protein
MAAEEDPVDLNVLTAKVDIALVKLSVLDGDHEKTYGKIVSVEKAQKQLHAQFVEAMERQEQRGDQILKSLQRVANETLTVRRAVEPGRWARTGLIFAGSAAGGAMMTLFLKLLGFDLPSKLQVLASLFGQ